VYYVASISKDSQKRKHAKSQNIFRNIFLKDLQKWHIVIRKITKDVRLQKLANAANRAHVSNDD